MTNTRLSAIKTMIRPIVRFSLRGHHTLQDFISVLKVAFVEVAMEELEKDSQKVNASRIGLMTGLHRSDLTKILKEGSLEADKRESNIAFRVIGQWEQDPEFMTRNGKPRVLSYRGKGNEFKALVAKVSKNLTYGSVLFELQRLGAVEKSKQGVKLIADRSRTTAQDEKIFEHLAFDTENLALAIEENYEDQQQHRNLHLTTFYDNILQEKAQEVREWFVKEGREFHRRAREYLAQYDLDVHPEPDKAGGVKVAFSTFSRTWDIEEQGPIEEDKETQKVS